MSSNPTLKDFIKITDYIYELSATYRPDMRVPARIYLEQSMFADIAQDFSIKQLINVATLPGIQKYSMAMPDVHQGYGFPIGGVAAMSTKEGVISPGGIGYDINCGVRLMVGDISAKDIKPRLAQLADALFHAVPSGVGKGGNIKVNKPDLDAILQKGAHKMVQLGFGNERDVRLCEEEGSMQGADAALISAQAKERGIDQLGTLGSGNHFLEVQMVEEILDQKAASAFNLIKDRVTVMIHCGSRGLGHQTCTDYVRLFMQHSAQWGITLPDKELVCAPFSSREGQDYFAAMQAAANFAWANRHAIGHNVRAAWQKILGPTTHLETVYDISHNIGKIERHIIEGKSKEVIMHRKGATRAFPAGHPDNPSLYSTVGHPVFIPGTMGTSSYVLVGTEHGMGETLGSCCHGAGRKMSRIAAKKSIHGPKLRSELEKAGILVRCDSNAGLAEEAPQAYKDVDEVVRVVQNAGIAKLVARLKPIAVIKGG